MSSIAGLLIIIVRLILAATFGLAGMTKLVDPLGTRRGMAAFGLPRRLANLSALLLPLAELGLAVALLFRPLARLAALAVLLLLLAFIAGITWNLIRGRKPDCRCFGQTTSTPLGAATILRDCVLALLALTVIIWGAGPQLLPALDQLPPGPALLLAGGLALLLIVIGQGWVIVQAFLHIEKLNRQVRLLEARLGAGNSRPVHAIQADPGLPPGSPAPDFTLPGLDGETASLDDLLSSGLPLLLVFLSPTCRACTELLPELAGWQRSLADRLSVVPISSGSAEANQVLGETHGLQGVLLQAEREVAQAYHCRATPAAVLVRPDGTLGSAPVTGNQAVQTLVEETLRTGS